MMSKVGEKLNLKEHWAGVAGHQKMIFGPTGATEASLVEFY
jgi:hypothetical protein